MRRRRGGALRRGAGPALLLVALAAAPLRAAFATVAELRRRLRERSLPVSGRKGELVARLRQGAGAARTPRPAAREAPLGPRAAGAGAAAAHERNKDLGGLAVAELQARLRSRGLPVSGRKAELVARLREAGEEDLGGLAVAELQARLRSRGLPVSGRKAELVARLREAGAEAGTGEAIGRGSPDRGLAVSDVVRAWSSKAGWQRATVTAKNPDDTYTVTWQLDGTTSNCSRGRMKRLKSEGFPVADLAPGQEVTGKVTSVQNYGVFVDVGAERDGLVHTSKLAEAAAGRVHKDVAVGDEVSAWVSQVRADGSLELTAIEGTAPSPRRALKVQSLEVGQKFEGVVVNVVQFGAFVDIGAERNGLVPREQTGAPPEDVQAAAAEGRPVAVWVTKVWPDDNFELTMKAHVGRSVAARPAARPAGGLEPGERLSGVVRAVMPYGFFVDVGSERDGLVPLSRMPAGEAVPQPGQEVAVWVRGVRPDGAIELTTDPEGHRVRMTPARDLLGKKVRGTVTRMMNFGFFVDVGAEREGLVPLEYVSEEQVTSDELRQRIRIGEEVDVWVTLVKRDGAIELSMVEHLSRDLHVGQKLRGTVTDVGEHAAYVSVGAERLARLPRRKMSLDADPGDIRKYVKKGQEIDVWVDRLGNNRISLTMVKELLNRDHRDISEFFKVPTSQWMDGVIMSAESNGPGVFVEVQPPSGGAPQDGLILHSEVKGFPKPGDNVRVRISMLDTARDRMFLTMLE